MKLRGFRFTNLFQHEELSQKIEGSLIGVIGRNGSGKSNVLNGFRFALGGDVPGKTKEKLVRWGATSGSVMLEYEHGGVAGTIERTVGATNRVHFKYGSNVDVTGITSCSEAIAAHIGMDKEILNAVFVQQAELDSVLFDQASKRELAFQRMCGIGDAAKINKVLGQIITNDFPALPDYDEQIALGKAQEAEMERRLAEYEKQLNIVGSELAQQVDPEQYRQQQIRCQQIMMAVDRASRVQGFLGTANHNVTEATAKLIPLKSQTDGIELGQIDERITQTRKTWEAAQAYRRVYDAWLKAKTSVDSLQKPELDKAAIAELAEKLKDLRDRRTEMMVNQNLYKSLRAAIESTTEATACPLCGQDIDDVEALRTRLDTKLKELSGIDKAAQDVIDVEKTYTGALARLQGYESSSKLLTDQLDAAQAALEAAEKVEADVTKLQNELNGMQQVRMDMERLFQQRTQLEAQVEMAQKQQKQYQLEYDAAIKAISDEDASLAGKSLDDVRTITAQTYSMTEQQLLHRQQLDVKVAGLRGQIGELKGGLQTIAHSIKELETRRAQQDTYKNVVDILTRVREWTHYSNGPHAVAVNVMEDLTANVNSFLQRLNAPFGALIGENGLAYRCPFTDGRPMPPDGPPDADDLSGGQKMLLAISFRLASYCMFANKQGILSLDEPTVYLDTENVSNFCNLLGKIKEVAQSLDLQLFISTHERSVIPFMDTIIDLSQEDEDDRHGN